MSSYVYPTLPGLGWSFIKTPLWKTGKSETASGREFRTRYQTYPRYTYKLTYEVLRERDGLTELQTLMGFFNKVNGSFDTFLFADPDDNAVTAQLFGTGDGVTTQFQLVRSRGGFAEPVFDLLGAPSVYINSTLRTPGTDYSLSATGMVTFTLAPPASTSLTWTGSFYWRCAFTLDSTEFDQFMAKLWSARTVEFRTVKP